MSKLLWTKKKERYCRQLGPRENAQRRGVGRPHDAGLGCRRTLASVFNFTSMALEGWESGGKEGRKTNPQKMGVDVMRVTTKHLAKDARIVQRATS